MNLKEVLSYLEKKFPNNEIMQIFQPSKDFVVFIAPAKGVGPRGMTNTPNSYAMAKDKKITPINPIADIDKFAEMTDKKYLIYSRY